MTRAEWRFLDMGRKLERSLHMVALLRGTMGEAVPQEGRCSMRCWRSRTAA